MSKILIEDLVIDDEEDFGSVIGSDEGPDDWDYQKKRIAELEDAHKKYYESYYLSD